jgi:NAD(P)H-hydrate repair Nnr-like enzyme with NAD(P)H-hydrate dehydratase domain
VRHTLDRAALDGHPPPPVTDGDKESKGRILVIAGSRAVPGAALLCATAAMRAGAGKLRIATVQTVAPRVGVLMPEAMVVALAEEGDGGFAEPAATSIAEQAASVDADVAGPGVKRNDGCAAIGSSMI